MNATPSLRRGPELEIARPRTGRPWQRLFALLLGVSGALGGAEFGLRYLLFGESAAARHLGRNLRDHRLYVRGPQDEDYWKLQVLLTPDVLLKNDNTDPRLGWTGRVWPGSYAHPDEEHIGDRRPILLFGDSNAQCRTGPWQCFQGLLERSDLASTHLLLNYGVGGYGLDQIYLLMSASIDRFADRDPIVIVSLMVDDNLERSLLSFRSWPKPRLRVVDGALVETGPVETDTLRYLRDHPPRIRSYLYRLLSVARLSPAERRRRTPAHLAELRELNRALLEAIRTELQARSMEHFFFLFYFHGALRRSAPEVYSEEVVLDFLRESGAPYVSMRDYLEAICQPPTRCLELMIGHDPVLSGHFDEGGNRLALEAMRQGIQGRQDLDRVKLMAARGDFIAITPTRTTLSILGRRAHLKCQALHDCGRFESSRSSPGRMLLGLRAGNREPTVLVIELQDGDQRLLATARAFPHGPELGEGSAMNLAWRLDEGEWQRELYRLGEDPRALALELAGARRLTLAVQEEEGTDPAALWLGLLDLHFE